MLYFFEVLKRGYKAYLLFKCGYLGRVKFFVEFVLQKVDFSLVLPDLVTKLINEDVESIKLSLIVARILGACAFLRTCLNRVMHFLQYEFLGCLVFRLHFFSGHHLIRHYLLLLNLLHQLDKCFTWVLVQWFYFLGHAIQVGFLLVSGLLLVLTFKSCKFFQIPQLEFHILDI